MGKIFPLKPDVSSGWLFNCLHSVLQFMKADVIAGLYPAVSFRESIKLSGSDRVAEDHESRREAPSRGGVWGGGVQGCPGVPIPRDGVQGCHPLENFEIWDWIWCNLVHFGKKLTVLQLSTFVNENIDIVAYYFTF